MDARPIQLDYSYPTAFHGWGWEERDAMDRVMRSEQFTMAGECEALEREFAAWHKMRYGIAVNSGSSANLIAVAALVHEGHLKPGDRVSVPALAWSTTYSPFVQHGIGFELVDCSDDWNAERLCSVQCSILGIPANSSSLIVTPWLEDNCESIGAWDDNKRLCGTRGLLNTFSTYWSHQLSAIEGGMILTNDPNLARICRLLRSHGWTRNIDPAHIIEDEFRFEAFGYNVRPLELHAAIARAQLKKLAERITYRRDNYSYWSSVSDGLPIQKPATHGTISPFGLHFCVDSKEIRQRLADALRLEGIDCRPPVSGSFRLQPYGAKWADQQTPNADRIHNTGLVLGCAPFPIFHLIDRAVKVMRSVL